MFCRRRRDSGGRLALYAVTLRLARVAIIASDGRQVGRRHSSAANGSICRRHGSLCCSTIMSRAVLKSCEGSAPRARRTGAVGSSMEARLFDLGSRASLAAHDRRLRFRPQRSRALVISRRRDRQDGFILHLLQRKTGADIGDALYLRQFVSSRKTSNSWTLPTTTRRR